MSTSVAEPLLQELNGTAKTIQITKPNQNFAGQERNTRCSPFEATTPNRATGAKMSEQVGIPPSQSSDRLMQEAETQKNEN